MGRLDRAIRRFGAVRPLSYVRVRVTAAATLVALVGAGIGSLLFLNSLHDNLQKDLVATAREQIQTVRAQLDEGESPIQAVVTGREDVIVQIADRSNHLVATDHPRITKVLANHVGTSYDVLVPELHERYLVVTARTSKRDQLIVVGRATEGISSATGATAVLLAISVPLGLALLALTVWLSVGRALRPVESMRQEAAAITSAHLHRRLAVPGGADEIPRLAHTLNEMLDRIDEASGLQRQFVSDASHELRSPLAALRQAAEVARDYPGHADAATLARDVLVEEQRMEELVTALLLLARLDDGEERLAEEVDLDDLVLAEVRRSRPEHVRIDASGVGAGQVRGDPVLLSQVVRNLLSNAMRHARSRVVVTLTEQPAGAPGQLSGPASGKTSGKSAGKSSGRSSGSASDEVVLEVDDDGNGIAPEERERVFDRFVRLDEARTRDSGGSGLGLAIVEKIVHRSGGRVEVTDSPEGGARFRVVLPTA